MKKQTTSGNQATSRATSDAAETNGYLTPMELAIKLKVSARTVTRYRSCGMPSHGRGRFVRYYLPEVEEWLGKFLSGTREH